MSDINENSQQDQHSIKTLRFGDEITMTQCGFSFQPVLDLELEIDDRVYMYSDDGNLEISLLGGGLKDNSSIAEINDSLAAELLGNVDRFELIEAGTDAIQDVRGFLNEIYYQDAGEEGIGRAFICSPHINQYFFLLIIASVDYWQNYGQGIFDQFKGKIQFHPQFSANANRESRPSFADLTLETFETVEPGEDFLLTIQKGDISILLAALADTQTGNVSVTQINTPDGTQLYHYDPATGEFASQIFNKPLIGDHGEVCVYLPRDNQNPLMPGQYAFSFETGSGAGLDQVQVIIRSGRAVEMQTLDINFWLAIEDDRFYDQDDLGDLAKEIIKSLEGKMLSFNLKPGKIEFFHPAMDELEAFTSINLQTDLADCSYMILESITNTRALNIGLVNQIFDGDPDVEDTITSISSGSPGMIMASASPHSCILLEWPAYKDNLAKFADAIIEQLIIYSGIDTRGTQSQDSGGLHLNHEIAWRIRRHPLFYESD
ncbi:MAG: hypothetical protein SCH68_00010 [Brevefilum sp.]|nr:hypothetical protein [Brevefilum sp.]